jgi:nucleoside-diphosphate-sugar epimerase
VIESLIHLKESLIVNIGSPELIKTEYLALKICNYFGLEYKDFVIEEILPEKMTLEKIPDIGRQTELTGLIPEITIIEGIKRVCDKFAITKNLI